MPNSSLALAQEIERAIRMHSTPTNGQRGYVVYEGSVPFIVAAIVRSVETWRPLGSEAASIVDRLAAKTGFSKGEPDKR